MSSTTSRLLRAACQAAGGAGALAARLAVSETMLERFMTDAFPVPDRVLLGAVDVILAEREAQYPEAVSSASQPIHGRPEA